MEPKDRARRTSIAVNNRADLVYGIRGYDGALSGFLKHTYLKTNVRITISWYYNEMESFVNTKNRIGTKIKH